jgi:hypothetical protein
MKNLVLVVLLAGLVAACGSKSNPKIVDAGGSGSGSADADVLACNVLTQTGCAAGQKCTWIHDATMPTPLGHVGCAANGAGAVGATCTYGADGPAGFDTCMGGLVCLGGKCRTICDNAGGAPMCPANFACSNYEGLFANAGQMSVAGVCDPSCDPLADNDFDGSGTATKTGSACPAANVGCYGYPSSTKPTKWSCTGEFNTTLVHRSLCTTAAGCANSSGNPYLNGCAQGYLPLMRDMTGGTGIVCEAICKPVNTYLGSAASPAGAAPHRCNNTDARGMFNTATATNNGDHCMFSWLFEIDAMGTFVRSPTSDTVGFCVDHSKYRYDSNGDGVLNGSDAFWPLCSSLPDGGGSGSAGDFGCVDTTHAGVTFTGKAQMHHPLMEMPRALYHPDAAQTP